MKILALFAALAISSSYGWSVQECPRREQSFHEQYTNGFLGANKRAEDGSPRYGLDTDLYDVYEPGQTYNFELARADGEDDVVHYYVVSTPVEDEVPEHCAPGSWQQLSSFSPEPMEGCEHVLEYRMDRSADEDDDTYTQFAWTAPSCGCITISAVVVTSEGVLLVDGDDELQGPLTMTLCPEDDEDDDTLNSLFDEGFYGIEKEAEEAIESVIDEVNDIITNTEEDSDEDEDDTEEELDEDATNEEEEEEEVSEEMGHRRFHKNHRQNNNKRGKLGKKNGNVRISRGKGKGKAAKWWVKEDSEDDEDESDLTSEKDAKKSIRWQRKMSRKQRGGPESEEKKVARLEGYCKKIDDKLENLGTKRGGRQLTKEAKESRMEDWKQHLENLLVCCQAEGDEIVACFQNAHGRHLSERMCSASEENYKKGQVPEKINAAKERCCESDGDDQRECLMNTVKVARKMKRQEKRNTPVDKDAKVRNICNSIEKRPVPMKKMLARLPIVDQNRWTAIFTERRIEMTECCQLEEADRVSCLGDIREARLDRVCQGEEPLSPPWKKTDTNDITEVCCRVEEAERYSCFDEKLAAGKRQKGGRRVHKKHHPGHRRFNTDDDVTDEKKEMTEDIMDADDLEERRRPMRTQIRKKMISPMKAKKTAHRQLRKQKRGCCHSGRTAGDMMEESAKRWRTCQTEAKGYIIDKDTSRSDLCLKSFRQCCMKAAIRNAREQAVDEADDKEAEEEDISVLE